MSRARLFQSTRLARVLLDAGADIDAPAFTEGGWHATPLWYAVARGENRAMSRFLLERGARPEHCLWAAAFRDDVDTIDLLVKHGATIDPIADSKGLTALHYALRKDSAPEHVEMLVRHGADPGRRARDGKSPLDLVARRRDKTYLGLLTRRAARRPGRSPQ